MKTVLSTILVLAVSISGGPAAAQQRQDVPARPARPGSASTSPATAGTLPNTGSGTLGERQVVSGDGAVRKPLARIDQRVQNRVQNRIRNRIDANYDPKANATAPFAVAEGEQRKVVRPRR